MLSKLKICQVLYVVHFPYPFHSFLKEHNTDFFSYLCYCNIFLQSDGFCFHVGCIETDTIGSKMLRLTIYTLVKVGLCKTYPPYFYQART